MNESREHPNSFAILAKLKPPARSSEIRCLSTTNVGPTDALSSVDHDRAHTSPAPGHQRTGTVVVPTESAESGQLRIGLLALDE